MSRVAPKYLLADPVGRYYAAIFSPGSGVFPGIPIRCRITPAARELLSNKDDDDNDDNPAYYLCALQWQVQ